MFSLDDIFERSISKNDVQIVQGKNPRRRRLSDHGAFKEGIDSDPKIAFPFPNGMKELFEEETGLDIFSGIYGPYRFLQTDDEVQIAKEWEKKRKIYIFLRDCLDTSIALDYNLESAGEYTKLGLAEHRAKCNQHNESIAILANAVAAAISDLPMYRRADFICAVPPSPGKHFDLPTAIVTKVASLISQPKLYDGLSFATKTQSVKELPLEGKWDALEASGLTVSDDLNGAAVVLIDDKYQSGTTAQFVASRLLDAGASAVHGLFCVKTWRDSDNS